MAAVETSLQLAPPNRPWSRQWLLFALQALLVVLVDACNDIFRGNIRPANSIEAMRNARQMVAFEASHGFFVEPGLQIFFRRTQSLLGLTVTWQDVVSFANTVYAFGHIFVTLLVAAWIYARHRERFAFVRNVVLVTNAVALVAYEVYPMAPPRLTSGLIFNHHSFHFRDTMEHIIGTGTLNGVPVGYNAYSAMPSVHVAWSLIMGLCLVWLARHPLIRLVGLLYPAIMVFTVVVTGNHYLVDVVGGAVAVTLAIGVASGWEVARGRRHPWRYRSLSTTGRAPA
jgi:membrane-associated phospholipid phosphatase